MKSSGGLIPDTAVSCHEPVYSWLCYLCTLYRTMTVQEPCMYKLMCYFHQQGHGAELEAVSIFGNLLSIVCCGRWLALHNSSLSVRSLIDQINRPSEKASYQAAASTYSTSLYGSTENFVQYIKSGALSQWGQRAVDMISL